MNDAFAATDIMTFLPTTASERKTQKASYASSPHSAVAQLLKLPNPMTLRKSLTMHAAMRLFKVKSW